ncbi:MAG: T9SS type A sorting domain-containing protein [Cryomorphaceae bacterium]
MRKYYGLVLLSWLSLGSIAQNYIAQRADFTAALDSSESTNQGFSKVASSVTDEWGNQYILSNYQGDGDYFNGDTVLYPGDSLYVGNGGAVLRKLGPEGDVIWTKPMAIEVLNVLGEDGSVPDCYGQRLAMHSDGDILMTVSMKRRGNLWYNNELSLSNYLGSTSHTGFILAKIDTGGSVQWNHRFAYDYSASNQDIVIESIDHLSSDASGNIYMTGKTPKFIRIGDTTFVNVIGTGAFPGSAGAFSYSLSVFALKLNSLGEHVWNNIVRFHSPSFGVGSEGHTKIRPEDYSSCATVDDSGNVYIGFLSDYFANTRMYLDDDTLLFPQHGQHFFTAKLNQATGLSEWFRAFECEWSSGSQFYSNGRIGSMQFLEDTLYQIISPRYNRVASLALDSNDTVTAPSTAGVYGYLTKMTSSGALAGYDVIQAPTNAITHDSQHRFEASTIFDGALYLTLHNASSLQVNGQNLNAYSSSSRPTLILRYDPNAGTYSINQAIIGDNISPPGALQLDARTLDIAPNADIYISGSTYAGSDFGEQELPFQPYSKGFITKYRNCDYLVAELTGDNTICDGEYTSIHALAWDSVDYAWLHNGFVVSGQTDSVLSTSVGGNYQVIVQDSNGCEATSPPFTVISQGASSVTLDVNPDEVCENDSSIILEGGLPTGGVYFGTAVSGPYFNPQVASIGANTVYYTATDSLGCVDTVSDVVFVNTAPSVYFMQTIEACEGDVVSLNGGIPSGGTYNGVGVVGSQFITNLAGVGTHILYYSYTNASGCDGLDSIQAVVKPTPTVSLNLTTDSTCENAALFALGGQSPPGGSFSGAGVSGNYFIPSIVDPGDYAISYSVTDSGCTGIAVDTMRVDSFPLVTLPALDSICLSATAYPLQHGFPSGGVYSGTGISSNVFDASIAGVGTHAVMYVFSNSCAADTAYSTITVIASPSLSGTTQHIGCNGGTDGSISVSVAGGAGGYAYAWSNAQATDSVGGLQAGTYTVTVQGSGGCMISGSFALTEPLALQLTVDSIIDVACNGLATGKVFLSTSGGTSPYAYSWSTGGYVEDEIGLPVGTHSATVTDANGCEDSVSISISEEDPISVTTSPSNVSCFGIADGAISTAVSGGTNPYASIWSHGDTTALVLGLDTGQYFLTVTDSNGCTGYDSSSIIQPDSLSLSMAQSDPTCFAYDDGQASVGVIGGVGPYAYAWSNATSSSSIDSLTAGIYSVTITDANGCTKIDNVLLVDPDSISVSILEVQSITCNGLDDGSLQSIASNGIGSISYVWSNSDTGPVTLDLTSGTYEVTVTDANGCFESASYNITEPSVLVASIDSVLSPLCNNDSNGFVTASAMGGTGSHTFLWSTGSSSAFIVNVDSGLYSVTVSDSNGCTDTAIVHVSDPDPLYATHIALPVSCHGNEDGSLTTSVFNAVGSTSFLWSNGQTEQSMDSLTGGSYYLTITDSNGCQGTSSADVFEPSKVNLAALTIIENECNGDSLASIAAVAQGGWGNPFNFQWSTGDSTATIDSLMAGSYSMTATDSQGCEYDTTIVLTDPEAISISVDSLVLLACYGDSNAYAALSGVGGTSNYAWEWSDASTQAVRNDLSAGTYSITLFDGSSGQCSTDTSIHITSPDSMAISIDSVLDVLCHGDSMGYVGVSVAGGIGPYNYAWSNGGDTSSLANLLAGNYVLTLTDANGCVATISQSVQEPDVLGLTSSLTPTNCVDDSNGIVLVQGQGGVEPYQYQWSTGHVSNVLTGLAIGTYTVTITDSNNCIVVDSFYLDFLFSTPNASLTSDTGICEGDSLILVAGDSGSYQWSTGSNEEVILVFNPGSYSLTITGAGGCESSDSIFIEDFPEPLFSLGEDTLICAPHLSAGITLQGPGNQAGYNWSTGSMDSTLVVTSHGVYWLWVSNTYGCHSSDTIMVGNDTCLSVSAPSTFRHLNVYPNPTRDYVNLERDDFGTDAIRVSLYNLLGERIATYTMTNSLRLEMGYLAQGVYILQCEIGSKVEFFEVIRQ